MRNDPARATLALSHQADADAALARLTWMSQTDMEQGS